MGLFGSSKKGSDSNNPDSYVDIENLPVAVAVVPEAYNQKQIVLSSKQGALNTNSNHMIVHDTRRGRRAVSPMPQLPASILFISRTPTLIPQCPVCLKTNVRTRTTTGPDWMTWVTVSYKRLLFGDESIASS
jgi:hypothetical protein